MGVMEATVPQLEKRLYRNNTGGWLGVVTLDHKNEEQGANVEPHGTIWLSDAEAILTARAPRRAEDNPFEEQTFLTQDPETGSKREVKVRPLVLVESDERFVPTERYVPTPVADKAARDAAPAVAQAPAVADVVPPQPQSSGGGQVAPPPPAPPVVTPAAPAPIARTAPDAPPAGLAGDNASADSEERESWLAEPEAPGRVLPGTLGGTNEGAPEEAAAAAPEATDPPAQRYVPPVVASQAVATAPGGQEEHAEAVDPRIGEETGAARPPAGPQPEGEYAQAEEVGSPDAPGHDEPLIGE